MKVVVAIFVVLVAGCQSIAGIQTKVPPDDAAVDDAGADVPRGGDGGVGDGG